MAIRSPCTERSGRLVLCLALVSGALALVHVAAMFVYYRDLLGWRLQGLEYWHISIFDLDEEESFGTWFATLLLFGCGLATWLHARSAGAALGRWRPWWLVLGSGFWLLSMDEVVGLHEYSNSLMEESLWTEWAVYVAGAVALGYLPLLWSLRWRTGLLMGVAGLLYVGGAVGVEHYTDWYAETGRLDTLEYNLWTVLEESLEMAGPILYLHALFDHARRSAPADEAGG